MKCPVCNRENGSGVNFCEGCGRRIPRCPTCGAELTSRDRFCANDGTRLSDDLLILVPEESILQAPVWTAPPANDLGGGTTKPGAAPEVFGDFEDENTVRVTAISGGNRIKDIPPVRNADPVNIPDWNQIGVAPEPPKRAYCENCGKRIAAGSRFCADCQRTVSRAAAGNKQKSGKKSIWIILLILLLLLGLAAGGYALVNSDLFDWESSNRAEKTDDEEDEEEEEESTDPVADDTDPTANGDDVPGVEDPVTSLPEEESTVPAEVTEPTTEATQPTTAAQEDPLMYWIENCDKMYLTAEDLEGFDAKMCVYARNACYAKSGRKFNSTDLQQYFMQFAWYNPTVSPDRFNASMLNAYQTANINVVLEYERSHGYN